MLQEAAEITQQNSSSKLQWNVFVELVQHFPFNAQFETSRHNPFLNKVSYT